ncbi:MAG: ATP-binding protein, partial [Clostridia bacterium]|nr:ATP-binding protein [Clostridia bacterium]
PYIFDRFYRSDKTRNTIKGHGLGLSIIKRITEIIGADITVESSLENGTRFIVSFDTSGKTLDKINDLIF